MQCEVKCSRAWVAMSAAAGETVVAVVALSMASRR